MTLEAMASGRVDQVLADLAVRVFADVLTVKVEQGIQLAQSGHLG